MEVVFGSLKEFFNSGQAPPIGNFALDIDPFKSIQWDHCREQFAAKFVECTKGLYFSHAEGRARDVAAFILKCEEILDITDLRYPYSHSQFSETIKDTVIWIEPSRFWLECGLKRSLLTVFLRCSINYDRHQDNFDDALFSEHYKDNRWARETKPAILRFLFGFTRFTGVMQGPIAGYSTIVKHGWHSEFEKAEESSIRRKLIRPEGEVMEPSMVGVESLWS